MHISAFDIFKVGIGPSSSHTVGPMRAAKRFIERLHEAGLVERTVALTVELFGSLAFTGIGHGSDKAIVLGLEGEDPATVELGTMAARVAAVRRDRRVRIAQTHEVAFDLGADLILHRGETLPLHSNGMRFRAKGDGGGVILERVYYSVGGGFVVDDLGATAAIDHPVPFPFDSGEELLRLCREHGMAISSLMLANEAAAMESDPAVVIGRLLDLWRTMDLCVRRGCDGEGILPGGLKVQRRAAALHRRLRATARSEDPLLIMDWVNLFALAVNEENAAGGRVVTAPTNGAAGIIPAVLSYYRRFTPNPDDDGTARFLLTAAAIGGLYKKHASISGAEVGCQGEVGVACSMAAAGLAEVLGGTPAQAENAAEIGMEHNLGLTCDPIGGLVQVPCIERNAMGAVKAINAARLALQGDGTHKVSLDKVIRTMRQTGADMSVKYKETARGGLAVNIIEC